MMIEASKLFGLRRDAGLLQRLGLSPEFTDDALGQRAASSSRLLSARTNAKSSRVAVRSVAVSRAQCGAEQPASLAPGLGNARLSHRGPCRASHSATGARSVRRVRRLQSASRSATLAQLCGRLLSAVSPYDGPTTSPRERVRARCHRGRTSRSTSSTDEVESVEW